MDASSSTEASRNLEKIEHIVVLMMENRSFDHMLGYLKIDGVVPEVEGLTDEMGNSDPDGVFHPVQPLGYRLIHDKVLDPGHGAADVKEQLEDGNGGFVRNFIRSFERNQRRHHLPPGLQFDPTLVLGYQAAEDVPVYDYLARNYTVCDHWFSSVPGPTWPNRLFAVTGASGPPTRPKLFGQVPKELRGAPMYDRPAFVRWLEPEQWRWYSHDPATLRLIDSRYRPGGERGDAADDNFAYFNRTSLFERRTFLDDAESGRLPAVSWIDPNFVDFRLYGPPGSNDDHPPSRVMLGQELVLTVLIALSRSPLWSKCLLLVTYDEHGGFYDHVPPGDFSAPGEGQGPFGLRVPALVVSPYAEAAVSHAVFEHTTIPKTILRRFAADPDEAVGALGERTVNATDLGELLTRGGGDPRPPSPEAELDELTRKVAEWKQHAYRGALLEEPQPGERLFEALTDLQSDIVGSSVALREGGLPPGKP